MTTSTKSTRRPNTAGRPFAPAAGPHPAIQFDNTPRNTEPVTQGFSEAAVARLRASAKKPATPSPKPSPAPAPEPKPAPVAAITEEPVAEPPTQPEPEPAPAPEPEPEAVASPTADDNPLSTFDLPTMADCPPDANNFERRDFVAAHFHDWYAWWRDNWTKLPKVHLIRHIGIANSIWYRYEAKVKNGEKIAPREAPPAPPPAVSEPLPPFDLPTMDDYTGDPTSNQQKNTYIMRYFPAWRQYQIDHEQTHAAMSRMTGASLPAWRRHVANFKESPELYGRPLPEEAEPFTLATMDDCPDGASHIEMGAFVRQHIGGWLQYMNDNHLSVEAMASLTGLSRSALYNHIAALADPAPEPDPQNVPFEAWESELLEDEETKRIADELEPAYQLEREMLARQNPTDRYRNLVNDLGNLVDDLRQLGAEVEVRVSYTVTHEVAL